MSKQVDYTQQKYVLAFTILIYLSLHNYDLWDYIQLRLNLILFVFNKITESCIMQDGFMIAHFKIITCH